MKRLMILFANGFPYNNAEPFLQHEYPLYKDYFDKVLVISGCRSTDDPHSIPDDPVFEFLPDNTLDGGLTAVLRAIPSVLRDPMFYRELKHLLMTKACTPQKLRAVLAMALCANRRAVLAKRWLSRHPAYRPQVIYSYWMHIPAYAAVRLKQIGDLSCPAVTRAHGYDLYAERTKTGYQPFHRQIFEKIDRIAVVSQHGKAYLERAYGQSGKIFVHRLGAVDHQALNPASDRSLLRIVSCSRVVPVKRLHLVVDALCKLKQTPVHWTHLGGGDGLETLIRYAAETLPAHVTAEFPGFVDNQQVYQRYEQMSFHAFVNVSESEGVPVSVMEAMSFGIPVLATAVGGIPELVEHGRSGFLLPKEHAEQALAACLMRLRTLPEPEYLAMRQAARTAYVQSYRIPDNYHRFLSQICDRNES